MKSGSGKGILLLGIMLLGMAGCVNFPVSKQLKEQAQPLTVGQVTANATPYMGTVVIWGGTILETANKTNGGSIYVLKQPLGCDQRPKEGALSSGRFIARSGGLLDPEEFRKGRLVTVAGRITGVSHEPLQQTQYAYPVIAIEEVRFWQRPPPFAYYPGYWYGPAWGWGWEMYGPDWFGPEWYTTDWGWQFDNSNRQQR